jgi:hypothetical protein
LTNSVTAKLTCGLAFALPGRGPEFPSGRRER